MGRALRIQYPGAWYHITSRGNERKAIFNSKGDRERFLSYLESAHERWAKILPDVPGMQRVTWNNTWTVEPVARRGAHRPRALSGRH